MDLCMWCLAFQIGCNRTFSAAKVVLIAKKIQNRADKRAIKSILVSKQINAQIQNTESDLSAKNVA